MGPLFWKDLGLDRRGVQKADVSLERAGRDMRWRLLLLRELSTPLLEDLIGEEARLRLLLRLDGDLDK